MNKALKGSIAIAAGVALLGGGLGSLAYWQTTENAGYVAVGVASFELERTGPPTYALNGGEIGADDIAFKPGDHVVYSVPYSITAEGEGLYAAADVTLGERTAVTEDGQPITVGITPQVTYELVSNSPNLQIDAVSGTDSFNVAGSGSATLRVIVVWPDDNWQAAQGGEFGVSPSQIVLKQVSSPLEAVNP
jgi:alternate signal-mediated exported protein